MRLVDGNAAQVSGSLQWQRSFFGDGRSTAVWNLKPEFLFSRNLGEALHSKSRFQGKLVGRTRVQGGLADLFSVHTGPTPYESSLQM